MSQQKQQQQRPTVSDTNKSILRGDEEQEDFRFGADDDFERDDPRGGHQTATQHDMTIDKTRELSPTKDLKSENKKQAGSKGLGKEEEERVSLVYPNHAKANQAATDKWKTPGAGPAQGSGVKQVIDVKLNQIKEPSILNMQAPAIRSKFPVADRISLALCGCTYKMDPVQIMRNRVPLFKFEEQFKEEKYKKMAMKLKVLETGSLILDPNMIHPFVRVHIIDMETYKYLSKSKPLQPGVANKESAAFLDCNKNYTRTMTDFIMPLSTQMYDLRIKGVNLAQWNEEFVINEYAHYLLRPNVLFLFEILDFNPSMICEDRKRLNAEFLYPVAWGYLRIDGTAQIHTSRNRLQLYKYKFNYDQDVKAKRPYDPRTPNVLLEFNWHKKVQYPSFLEIEVGFTNKMETEIPRKHFSRAPWEKEVGLVSYDAIERTIARPSARKDGDESVQTKHLLKRWEKFEDYPSELPNLKIWKFDTDSLGAFKLKFSNKGKYLAVACTMASSKTIIKIYDVENGELKIVLRGHHDLIHELCWSLDDNFLLSSSADCSTKLWNLTQKETDYSDKLNYTENDVMYYMCSLLHPSYVYASLFYPDFSYEREDRLVIATACYDQKVRLWLVSTGPDGHYLAHECLIELSIMEKPQQTIGAKASIYEQEELEDETLEMIVRPNKTTTTTTTNAMGGGLIGQTTVTTTTLSVFDYIHPNCMAFNNNGRLFVGDSRGHISCWDIALRHGNIYADNYFKIRQKEIEGDEINQIICHPEFQNKIFVHSRDNCIRLVEYDSYRGPRIRKRFFGAKCKDLMIKSCLSPDGQYIVSGSEDGKPYIWNAHTHDSYRTKKYECKFLDLVSDADWNPKYNMFAISGFGHQFPVLVYVYQRTEEELNEILFNGGGVSVKQQDHSRMSDPKADRQLSTRRMNQSRFDKENSIDMGTHKDSRGGSRAPLLMEEGFQLNSMKETESRGRRARWGESNNQPFTGERTEGGLRLPLNPTTRANFSHNY